jgi:uncharacterized protein
MKSGSLKHGHERTFVLMFEAGDEVVHELEHFARKNRIAGGQLSAMGAFSNVTLACFDWKTKRYKRAVEIRQQVQLLSLVGDIAHEKGHPAVHCFVVVAKQDGAVFGGRLVQAHVRPALEVILMEASQLFQRRYDPETGLALLRPDPHGYKP